MRANSNMSQKEREITNAMNGALMRYDSKIKRKKIKEIEDKISAEDIKKQKLKDEGLSAISSIKLEKRLKRNLRRGLSILEI